MTFTARPRHQIRCWPFAVVVFNGQAQRGSVNLSQLVNVSSLSCLLRSRFHNDQVAWVDWSWTVTSHELRAASRFNEKSVRRNTINRNFSHHFENLPPITCPDLPLKERRFAYYNQRQRKRLAETNTRVALKYSWANSRKCSWALDNLYASLTRLKMLVLISRARVSKDNNTNKIFLKLLNWFKSPFFSTTECGGQSPATSATFCPSTGPSRTRNKCTYRPWN